MCEMPYFTWAAVCKGFPEGHASVVDALALVCQIAFLCVPEVCANVIGGISGLDVHDLSHDGQSEDVCLSKRGKAE